MLHKTKNPKTWYADLLKEIRKSTNEKAKELREQKKELETKELNLPEVQAKLQDNEDRVKKLQKKAGDYSGLYWSTKGAIRSDCRSMNSGPPPKYRAFRGEGQLSTQIQKRKDEPDFDWTKKNSLFYMDGSTAYMRIGSDGRQPIWVKLYLTYHRPIPEGASIKWIHLQRCREGKRVKYKLRFAVEQIQPIPKPDAEKWVAIRPGYGEYEDHVRAAIAVGYDGKVFTLKDLIVDEHKRNNRIEKLASERDLGIERAKEVLSKLDTSGCHKRIQELLKSVGRWKSPGRFISLREIWNKRRVGGDESAFDKMMKATAVLIRRHDEHCRLSARIHRQRDNEYRVFVAKLRKQYDLAIVPNTEYKAHVVDKDNPYKDVAKTNARRSYAAPGKLRSFVMEKFYYSTLKVKPLAGCCECRGKVSYHGNKVICKNCGSIDADQNALANLVASGQEAIKNGEVLELREKAIDDERKKKERLLKMQKARKKKRGTRKEE